jgi:uncharacterized membrane protein YhaH (DUF805 family)
MDADAPIIQLLPFFLISLITIFPVLTLLKRTGKSKWWALFVLSPWLGLIVLFFILAYSNWPAEKKALA